MFKPTNAIKKILVASNSCAYIHTDGIVITEQRTVKISKNDTARVEVRHIIPCDIRIAVLDYAQSDNWENYQEKKVDRLVVHDTRLIVNGFDFIEVIFQAWRNKELGITANRIRFYNGDMIWECTKIPNMMSGNVAIQPDHTENYGYGTYNNSVVQYANDYSVNTVIHGELPEIKTEILQLTVNS